MPHACTCLCGSCLGQPDHRHPRRQGRSTRRYRPATHQGEKRRHRQASRGSQPLARDCAPSPRLVRAGHHAVAFLAGVVRRAPTACRAVAPGRAGGGARPRGLCPVAPNDCEKAWPPLTCVCPAHCAGHSCPFAVQKTCQALGPDVYGIFYTLVRLVRCKLVMALCQCAAENV